VHHAAPASRTADTALVGGLAALTLAEALIARPGGSHPALALAGSLALVVPLAARRRRPLLVCWLVALGFALVTATGALDPDEASAPSLTLLVAVASAARHTPSPWLVAASTAGVVALSALATGMFDDGPPALGDLLFGVVFVAGAVALARTVRGGALRRLRLLVELDGERSARDAAEAAARQERHRLARELHDLSSHHLVVAAMHAGIAARADEEQRAAEATEIARAAVFQAAGALAGLTGAPAAGDAPDGAGALVDALAQARALGARCEAPEEALGALPGTVALTAARILQEGLTNAAKHAPGAELSVTVAMTRTTLAVELRNGPGRPGALPDASGGGLGLAGMRERVRLLGGSLATGRRRGGGWRVAARLPLSDAGPRWAELLRGEVRGGAPAWALALCTGLGAWGLAEAVVLDDGPLPGARAAVALLAALAPALLWRRPAALAAAVVALLALRAPLGTFPTTSSPIVLLAALAAYAVAREAVSLRGGIAGVLVVVLALPLSFALDRAQEPIPDLAFLPGLVLGAGVAGLLLRLHASDSAALGGALESARSAAAAERAAAVALERERLERELAAVTERSLRTVARLAQRAVGERGAARARTLAELERRVAATLADVGRLAAVLRRS
jgi:signal transduction histidine kinase